jgi:hypothetical protein
MIDQYYLKVQSQSVCLAVGVNRAAIIDDYKAEGVSAVRPINEWILPEGNELTVSITWPRDKSFEAGKARVTCSVFLADPRSPLPRPGVVLATATWPSLPAPEVYPASLAVPFKIERPTPAAIWGRAEHLRELTIIDRNRIFALVKKLEGALVARDAPRAFEVVAFRYEDDAAAYGHNPQRIRELIIKGYETLMAQQDYRVVPLQREDAEFAIVGKDQLVLVTRENQGKAIVVEAQGMKAEIAVLAARMGNEWVIGRTA